MEQSRRSESGERRFPINFGGLGPVQEPAVIIQTRENGAKSFRLEAGDGSQIRGDSFPFTIKNDSGIDVFEGDLITFDDYVVSLFSTEGHTNAVGSVNVLNSSPVEFTVWGSFEDEPSSVPCPDGQGYCLTRPLNWVLLGDGKKLSLDKTDPTKDYLKVVGKPEDRILTVEAVLRDENELEFYFSSFLESKIEIVSIFDSTDLGPGIKARMVGLLSGPGPAPNTAVFGGESDGGVGGGDG